MPFYSYSIDEGTGPIHLNNFQCSSSDSLLIECPTVSSAPCSHAKDVAVHCGMFYTWLSEILKFMYIIIFGLGIL